MPNPTLHNLLECRVRSKQEGGEGASAYSAALQQTAYFVPWPYRPLRIVIQ